jgi:hypothetical protein
MKTERYEELSLEHPPDLSLDEAFRSSAMDRASLAFRSLALDELDTFGTNRDGFRDSSRGQALPSLW